MIQEKVTKREKKKEGKKREGRKKKREGKITCISMTNTVLQM